MNALAEQAVNATDEEISQDFAAEGDNPRDCANRVQSVLLGSVQRFKRNRLHAAMERHKQNTRAFQTTVESLPASPAARRALLDSVLSRAPDVTNMVAITVQHRDFKSLSDEDIETVLRQLHHLGLLDANRPGDREK